MTWTAVGRIALSIALVAACSGKDEETTGAASSSEASAPSTTDPTTTGATTTDATTTDATTTDTDSSTTAPDLPPGQCWSEFHGVYWCECEWHSTQPCEGDGVMTCFWENDQVISHLRWGPCGECGPGDERACDKDGAPGRQFCDVAHDEVADINDLPAPKWGVVCLLDGEVVCQPGETEMCEDGIFSRICLVDAMGVPYWGPC